MKHQPPDDLGPLFAPRPLGETIVPERDEARLGRQYVAVRDIMADGEWHTLGEIAFLANAPEASASARLRDMRRDGWEVEREYVRDGLHKYRAKKLDTGNGVP